VDPPESVAAKLEPDFQAVEWKSPVGDLGPFHRADPFRVAETIFPSHADEVFGRKPEKVDVIELQASARILSNQDECGASGGDMAA